MRSLWQEEMVRRSEKAILTVLGKAGRPLSRGELLGQLTMKSPTLSQYLRKMVADGRVLHTLDPLGGGRGVYAVAPTVVAPLSSELSV